MIAKERPARTNQLDARLLALFAASWRRARARRRRKPRQNSRSRGKAFEARASLKNQFTTAEASSLKSQIKRRIARGDPEILDRIQAADSVFRCYATVTLIPSSGFAAALA
jgi:hypothetical protein